MPSELGPAMANDTNTQFVLNLIADGLIGWSFKEGIYPEISESWEERSEGEVIFKLKSNIKNFLGEIQTCKEINAIFNNNKKANGPFLSTYNEITSIDCKSPILLHFKSKMSTKSLLSFLASPQGKIINYIENKKFNGVGPFDIVIQKNEINLTKNNFYYDSKNIHLKAITLIVKNDQNSIQAFKKKELDLILLSNLTGLDTQFALKDEIHSLNLWSTWGIAFNQKIKPFDDKKLRHCLIQNTNSAEWIQLFYPSDLPAFGPIPFGVIGYTKAKKIFSQKITPVNEDVKVYVPKELQRSDEMVIWIKNNFSKCMSKEKIKIIVLNFDKMLEMFNSRSMGAYLMSFNKETISNEQYYRSFYALGKENFYNNNSIKTASAFEGLAKATSNDFEKVNLEIQNSLAEDAVMIPLMHPVHKVLIRNCIKNVILNPINEGYFNIKNARNLCN